jgi:hypothetical protein
VHRRDVDRRGSRRHAGADAAPVACGRAAALGEPFWHEPPPDEALVALECGPEDFASLDGTLDRFDAAELELVEMVLADADSWDRYVAAQWWTIDQWLRVHRDDPRADELHDLLVAWRRAHLEYGRRYLGWGVFVLR